MYKYFVEKPKLIELKKQIYKTQGLNRIRVMELYNILGDVIISKELLNGFLNCFKSSSKRGDLILTKESLIGMYELSLDNPNLSSKGYKMIMGEYIKELFDELEPLNYFDNMSLKEKDESFETFMTLLKAEGQISDLKYLDDVKKLDKLKILYGNNYVEYLKKLCIKYHKSYDEIYKSIPEDKIIKKDERVYYNLVDKDKLSINNYPYSYQMTKSMLLFNELKWFKNKELIYDSIDKEPVNVPFTINEFIESVEEHNKPIEVDNKIINLK